MHHIKKIHTFFLVFGFQILLLSTPSFSQVSIDSTKPIKDSKPPATGETKPLTKENTHVNDQFIKGTAGHPKRLPSEVIEAQRLNNPARSNSSYVIKENDSAGIGDILVVTVKNFSTILDRSNGIIDANFDSIKTTKQQIGLFLDGRLISDIAPESGAPQKDTTKDDVGTFRFHLQRNSNNDEAWADILGSPKSKEFFIYKNIPVSVGLINEYAVESHAEFNLVRANKTMFWVCSIGFLFYLFGLVALAQRSNILRDSWVDASSIGIERKSTSNVFSLGRLQMAFWFSLVIASYLFIWLITGAIDILTSTTLTLIGISAGTALGSVVIGNSKGQDLVKQTADLIDERSKLKVSISSISPADIAASPALQATLAQQQSRLTELDATILQNKNGLSQNLSKGFLMDILSDENGIGFHRLQMCVWTIILGILFVHSVWTRLSMPEFSTTLLALQGITSGTYLGFKIPEKQT